MLFFDGFFGAVVDVVATLAFVAAVHYFYLLRNRNYWTSRGVFSPEPARLFGNFPGQVDGSRNIMYELDDFYQRYRKSHACVGLFNFRSPRLLLLDVELVRDVFIRKFRSFQASEMYGRVDENSDPLFGNHMFFQVGDKWKSTRQQVAPALTNLRIKAIHPIMENVANKMKSFVRQEIAKPDFNGLDVKDLSERFTISIVSNSIFNVDPRTFEGGESEILKQSQVFLAPSRRVLFKMLLHNLYPFLGGLLKFSLSQPGSQTFFFDLMENSMRQREASGARNMDYLDHLMQLKRKKEISDHAIAGHGASFIVDGYDTSSTLMAGALFQLGKHKAVQDRLRREINEKMPTDDDFNYDNVLALEYLDQVLHECLRLYSPGLYVSRMCTEDVTLELPKDKSIRVSKGAIVYVPVNSIAKDPEFFERPLDFDPDRFSPENGGVKAYMDRGVFFPFGLGPRMCPGNRFAFAQAKWAVASLIKDFEVSLNPRSNENIEVHPAAFVLHILGIYLDFKEIKKQ